MKDNKHYMGYTHDLQKRMKQHQGGKSFATAPRRPFELIYYEACRSESDAKRREGYFETTGGRRYLAKRLKDHYAALNAKLH